MPSALEKDEYYDWTIAFNNRRINSAVIKVPVLVSEARQDFSPRGILPVVVEFVDADLRAVTALESFMDPLGFMKADSVKLKGAAGIASYLLPYSQTVEYFDISGVNINIENES